MSETDESDTTISNFSDDSDEELYDSNDDDSNEENDDNDGGNIDDNDDDNDNRNNDDERSNNDEEENNNQNQTKQKPKTSNVWDFVDKVNRKCSCCGKVFKKKTGTSSIRSHLKSHGILLGKKKQTTLDNFTKSTQTEKKLAMIEWIVLDMQPFKVIEGDAFRKMISKFDPKHETPTRNTVKNLVVKLFKKRRESIKNYVETIPGKVALTTDIWSSLKSEGFLGVTIHFIDNNWLLKHFTLDIFQFKGSHTGEAISNEIYKLLEEFKLENKTIAITTDNASNMISCARQLRLKFGHNDFIHYRCVAHILNLIVSSGLDIVKENIKKLRKLMKMIKRSSKILEELENLSQLNHQPFLRPIIDIKTRWNSTYKMINRACTLKENISMLAVKYPTLNNYLPTQMEWELLHDLNQFLEPFDNATTNLSSQSYPTIAHSRIILLAIKIDLYADRGDDSLLKDMIIPMREKFETYYEVLKEITHIAAFLDPRYKSYCFPDMNNNEILQPIQQKLEEIQPATLVRSSKISSFLQKLKSTRSNEQIVDDEVTKYWNSNDAEENVKPLEWWKTHSTEYPNLSKLAVDYLCIQASSVPCEQLFSVAGQILCKTRNRLTGESVRASICLRSWMSENIH